MTRTNDMALDIHKYIMEKVDFDKTKIHLSEAMVAICVSYKMVIETLLRSDGDYELKKENVFNSLHFINKHIPKAWDENMDESFLKANRKYMKENDI